MNLVLQTERLTLLPYSDSEVGLAIEVFTDPEVMRYADGVMEGDEIRGQMPNWTRRGGVGGCIGVWCIRLRGAGDEPGERLGSVALLPLPVEIDDTDFDLVVPGRMPDAEIEVGYYLKRSAWGKGYATEACRRLLRFAFEESPLEEVVATFTLGNDASRNVLLKAGFVDHGMRRCYGTTGPDFRITREEWRSGASTAS